MLFLNEPPNESEIVMAPIGLVLLLLVEACGCKSGVYRDAQSGLLVDNYGYWDMCDEHLGYYEAEAEAEARAEIDAEQAYERYLENAGWQEARLQEEMEARAGVLSYEDARDLAEGRGCR